MNRETKNLKTPSGKELVLKTFLNAGERNQLRGVYLSKMKLNADGTQNAEGIDGSVIDEAEKKLVELAVVSYDSKTADIYTSLLELHPDEYDFIIEAVRAVDGGNFKSAK